MCSYRIAKEMSCCIYLFHLPPYLASCLVPLSDMFNMAAREEEVNVRCDTNENSTHFECHTTTTIPSGKQVLEKMLVILQHQHLHCTESCGI